MTDINKIIKAYLAGSSIAGQQLIQQYKTLLYSFSIKLARNRYDAEDLFQDTWVKVFNKLHTFNDQKSFENWLFTICLNTYRDQYSKTKRWINIIQDFFTSEQKEKIFETYKEEKQLVEEQVIQLYEEKVLIEKLNQLHDRFRVPIILYYFHDLTYKEISMVIKIPEGTVKSRISLGKKKLKDLIEESDISE